MLQILQTRNPEKYTAEISQLKISDNNPNVVEAVDNDCVIGFGIYYFAEKSLVIEKVECDGDLSVWDGIARAVLFLGMLKGVDSAVFSKSCAHNAQRLGFVPKGSNLLEPVSGFMSKCKNCGK